MAQATSSRKAMLGLGLVVLVLHLGLLQSLPMNLSGVAANAPTRSLETRTVVSGAGAVAAPTPVRPRRANVKPEHRSVPSRTVAESAAVPSATPEAVPTAGPGTAADAPILPASQELVAPVPPAELDQLPVSRPPREVAATFSLDGLPGSMKLNYRVSANKFPFNLNGELVWRHDPDHYQASLSFGALGQTRVQTSRGLIGAEGLAPERFSDKYRSEVAAHFNRAQGRVTFSANTPDAPLLAGAQDR